MSCPSCGGPDHGRAVCAKRGAPARAATDVMRPVAGWSMPAAAWVDPDPPSALVPDEARATRDLVRVGGALALVLLGAVMLLGATAAACVFLGPDRPAATSGR